MVRWGSDTVPPPEPFDPWESSSGLVFESEGHTDGGYADCLQEQRNLAAQKAKHRRMLVRIDGISEVRVREALEDLRFSRELETAALGRPA